MVNMNQNDIVYLKSDTVKLSVTWLIGETQSSGIIDFNRALMQAPNFQPGDICLKYNEKDKQITVPRKCVITQLNDRVPVSNQNIEIGNVVKNKLTQKEMVVIWIIGQEKNINTGLNLNEIYRRQGYQDGDLVCGFFEKNKYNTTLFRKGEVDKTYE